MKKDLSDLDLFVEVLNSDSRYKNQRQNYFQNFASRVQKTWRKKVFGRFKFIPEWILTYHKRFILAGSFLIFLAILTPSIFALEIGLPQDSDLKPSKVVQNSNLQKNTENILNQVVASNSNSNTNSEEILDGSDLNNTEQNNQNNQNNQNFASDLEKAVNTEIQSFINSLECGQDNSSIILNSTNDVLVLEKCPNENNLHYLSSFQKENSAPDKNIIPDELNQNQNKNLKLIETLKIDQLNQNSVLGNNSWIGAVKIFENTNLEDKIIILIPGRLNLISPEKILDLEISNNSNPTDPSSISKTEVQKSFSLKNLTFENDGINFEYTLECDSGSDEESVEKESSKKSCQYNQKLNLIDILEKLD